MSSGTETRKRVAVRNIVPNKPAVDTTSETRPQARKKLRRVYNPFRRVSWDEDTINPPEKTLGAGSALYTKSAAPCM